MNKPDKLALYSADIALADDCVAGAIIDGVEDGRYFELSLFIDHLASRLDTLRGDKESPVGRFDLDPIATARYLWCCLALESGDKPDGHTFRGLPIAD